MEQAPLERIHHKKGSSSDLGCEEARAGGWVVKNGDTKERGRQGDRRQLELSKAPAWPDKI